MSGGCVWCGDGLPSGGFIVGPGGEGYHRVCWEACCGSDVEALASGVESGGLRLLSHREGAAPCDEWLRLDGVAVRCRLAPTGEADEFVGVAEHWTPTADQWAGGRWEAVVIVGGGVYLADDIAPGLLDLADQYADACGFPRPSEGGRA